MRYQATVINGFEDKNHDGHVYVPGDIYPAEGYRTTKKRIEFLAQVHPEYKVAFVSDIQEIEDDKKGKAEKE